MLLLITILIPILDLFLYKTHLLNIPMAVRCFYVTILLPCFLISFMFFVDDIFKKLESSRIKKENEKQKQLNYIQQLKAACNIAFPILSKMTIEETILLSTFIEQKNTEIVIENKILISLLTPAVIANNINTKLYPLWIIDINTTATHTILTISKPFFDVLNNYFAK